jgi:hypothetical protein
MADRVAVAQLESWAKRGHARLLSLLVLALVGLLVAPGCQARKRRPAAPIAAAPIAAAPIATAPVATAPVIATTADGPAATALAPTSATLSVPSVTCEAKVAALLKQPGLPGAPALEAQRLQVLTDSKAEPVWFAVAPTYGPEEVSAPVARYRKQINETKFPVDVLTRLLPAFAQAPRVGREVLLRDGYLFADNPNLARALVTGITVEHLFAHDSIWIRRGELLMHAERRRGLYYYTDGPNVGDRVTLLLFDELGHGPVPDASLARDFRALQAQLHFDRASVKHATASKLLAELLYGTTTVTTLLSGSGPHLELDCEIVPNGEDAILQMHREAQAKRFALVQQLRTTMLDEVAEKLPFDEPRREWGLQLDGRLRQNWRHAYSLQRSSFALNGDRYFVFDAQGRPIVPQVCVDFLTDTFERTSGTWYRPEGQPPGRDLGKLDFDAIKGPQRDELRRVPVFVDYARRQTTQFEVLDLPEQERIALGDPRFVSYLASHAGDYRPGDVVVIRGPTPWDRRQQHYHSFFIYESDPITGLPIAVVGNAGRPTVRYWRVETQRTPRRTIWHRLRPKTEWLESIVNPERPTAPVPPPLSPKGNPGL